MLVEGAAKLDAWTAGTAATVERAGPTVPRKTVEERLKLPPGGQQPDSVGRP
jgi:hypothetical protein